MGPSLPGDIDALDSIQEVWRVVQEDVALMAMRDDRIVGTVGIVRPSWWFNKKLHFLANRWFAVLPGTEAGKLLLEEGAKVAKASGLELHVYDETKGRLVILNRHRRRSAENPVLVNPQPGQPVLVGEKGPEVFVPGKPGTVVPYHRLKEAIDKKKSLSTKGLPESGEGLADVLGAAA